MMRYSSRSQLPGETIGTSWLATSRLLGRPKPVQVEPVRQRDRASGCGAPVLEVGRPRQDPQVITVGGSDNRPRIVIAETDDPIVAPDEGGEGQPGGRKPHLQSRERVIVDAARDASRLDPALGGTASVHDVKTAIGPPGVAGADLANTGTLEPIRIA